MSAARDTARASLQLALRDRPVTAAVVAGQRPVGKAAWRAWARKQAQARSQAQRRAHEVRAACELLAVAQAHHARVIGLYSPIGTEVGTRELANLLLANGHILAYPRLRADDVTIDFCRADGPAALHKRPRSRLLEPAGEAIGPADLDLLVVPAMALHPSLARLGRGGGSFDRFLPTLPDDVARVGLVAAACVAHWAPVQSHDAVLDAVCTEHGLFGPGRD